MSKQMVQYESNDQPPEEIFLQWMGHESESTWCSDETDSEDVHYVRGDIYAEALEVKATLLEALNEIAKGEGAFSMDPLTFANSTIENMKEIARDVIVQAKGEQT